MLIEMHPLTLLSNIFTILKKGLDLASVRVRFRLVINETNNFFIISNKNGSLLYYREIINSGIIVIQSKINQYTMAKFHTLLQIYIRSML